MWRNNEEKDRGNIAYFDRKQKKKTSNIPEKLELRGFAAKMIINRPKLNKFTQLQNESRKYQPDSR